MAKPPLSLRCGGETPPAQPARTPAFRFAILLAATSVSAETLTFPAALEQAMRARAADTSYDAQARTLEAIPFGKTPIVRAETGFSRAEDLNVLTQNIGRFDAFTAIVAVDYPLLDAGAAKRRAAVARTDAQLLRSRALDEADEVFQQTLDAFAQLYLAQRRIEMLSDTRERATALRTHTTSMIESGTISNLTAAQWQDQALATESMLVDLELQRLDAETRLKQLTGNMSAEPLRAEAGASFVRRPPTSRASIMQERKRLAFEDALALRKPQLLMSGWGGIATIPGTFRDSDEGTFGIYGMRFTLSLPIFDGTSARRVAETRIELQDAERATKLAADAERNRTALLQLALSAADKRIALMKEAIDVAKRREESLARLVSAGVRTDADLLDATNATARRESDLVALEVERWKLEQRLAWNLGAE